MIILSIKRQLRLEYALLGFLGAIIPCLIGILAAHYSTHPVFFTVCSFLALPLGSGGCLLLFHRRINLRTDLLKKAAAASGAELSDCTSVEVALRNLYVQQMDNRDKAEAQNNINKARLVERLLGDNRHTLAFADAQDRLDQLVRQDLLQMSHSGFCLICLRIDDYGQIFQRRGDAEPPLKDFVQIRDTIQSVLQIHAPEDVSLYCVEYDGHYMCLVNLDFSPTEDSFHVLASVCQWCGQSLQQLETDYAIVTVAALATPFLDITDAHDAAQECMRLLCYADMLSLGKSVVSALDLPKDAGTVDTHQKQLWKKYVHSVSTLDMPKARDLLMEILDPKYITTPQHAQTVNQMVLFHLGIAFETLGCKVEKHPEIDLLCRNISSATSLTEIASLVDQIFDLLNLPDSPLPKKEDKAQQLLQYIDENYMDPDLNLTILSERFEMNPSYVARIFKERTGQSVLTYLQQKRLTCAKELLETTNLNLTDIALRTGYGSGWTLTRAFKRSEGITPGAYRQMSQTTH